MNRNEEMSCTVDYLVFAEKEQHEGMDNVVTYGIQGVCGNEQQRIHSISSNYWMVKKLSDTLKRCEVSLVHMVDVITDAIMENELYVGGYRCL